MGTDPLLLVLLLVLALPPSGVTYVVTETYSDSIDSGSITYFKLEGVNPIFVVLITREGDVDLFASPSHKNSKPSGDDYELSSASCGIDMLAIELSNDVRKYSLGVSGHEGQYEKSTYSLIFISPSKEDIEKYQIWEWDPETQREVLVMDVNTMTLLNDPDLNALIDTLVHDPSYGSGAEGGGPTKAKRFVEFGGYIVFKLFEILLEILL